jgi:hypothetical protein
MSDHYPETLNIEIDRHRLRNYLRTKWLLSWVLSLGLFGGMAGFASIGAAVERGSHSWQAGVGFVAKSVALSFGSTTLLALLLYFILSHRLAARFAASLHISVEGAFLRVRQHTSVLSDRKLHFRSIVDYAITQDFLMRRFGIHALQMATTAGGQNTNLIIPGVKDCLRVRDLLADIDSQRENQ